MDYEVVSQDILDYDRFPAFATRERPIALSWSTRVVDAGTPFWLVVRVFNTHNDTMELFPSMECADATIKLYEDVIPEVIIPGSTAEFVLFATIPCSVPEGNYLCRVTASDLEPALLSLDVKHVELYRNCTERTYESVVPHPLLTDTHGQEVFLSISILLFITNLIVLGIVHKHHTQQESRAKKEK